MIALIRKLTGNYRYKNILAKREPLSEYKIQNLRQNMLVKRNVLSMRLCFRDKTWCFVDARGNPTHFCTMEGWTMQEILNFLGAQSEIAPVSNDE